MQTGGAFAGSSSIFSTILVDATYVYYTGSWNVAGAVGRLTRAPKAGGTGTSLGTFDVKEVFAMDASSIHFWSNAVYRVSKTGVGSPVFLSTNVNNVTAMVVHAEAGGSALYWVNKGVAGQNNGSIVKIALQ